MEKDTSQIEGNEFWTPKWTDGPNLALRYPLLPYSQRTFIGFVGDVVQTHSKSNIVGFEGFPKVSEDFVRLHLLEYALHYINKYKRKLPQELQTPIQQALTLAFNNPQRKEDSVSFHFPFITESFIYRTVYRQIHSVNGEYCIKALDLLSEYLSRKTIVMVIEDVINGSMIDMKDVGITSGEVIRAYDNMLWRFLPYITRFGSQFFGPVLGELVLHANDTPIAYTITVEEDGVSFEEQRSTSRQIILMDNVSRLLSRWASDEGKYDIANSLMSHVATLQRNRDLDEYWLTFISGTPQAEGVRNFIRATFSHWDIAYKQQILNEIKTMSEYMDFQADGVQIQQYISLIDEIFSQEQDVAIIGELTALKTELEQTDTPKAKAQLKEARIEAERKQAQRERIGTDFRQTFINQYSIKLALLSPHHPTRYTSPKLYSGRFLNYKIVGVSKKSYRSIRNKYVIN